MNTTSFKDKRKRSWEMFEDRSYFDMWCVRAADDKSFNSPLSFHFNTYIQALNFKVLIENSH